MEELGVARGYIELDITSMSSAVADAEKELAKIERAGKLAQSEFKNLESAGTGVGSAFKQADEKAYALGQQIGQAKQKSEVYRQEIEGLNTIISRSKTEQEELSEKIRQVNDKYTAANDRVDKLKESYTSAKKEIESVTKEFGENSKEAEEVQRKHKGVIDEYDRATTASEKYRNELLQLQTKHEALGIEIDGAGQKVVEFQTDLNNTNTEISNMEKRLAEAKSFASNFGQEMQNAGEKIHNAGEKINKVGSVLTAGVTTPLVGAGTAAVKFALDAGDGFAKVSTIADETVLSMESLKTGVMNVSDETGVAVTEFNEALYQTISATGDTANAIGYTEIAAKAAKGGFTDTATAVDGLTTIMNSYGLSGVENMQKVSDMMLMTQNYGKTTFGELASSMGNVVPIASQMNMSVEELMSIMATLTKNGIGTSEAVTGLKAALSNIIKPSTEAAEAADALGLDFSASAVQTKGFSGVMADVQEALKKAAPEYAELATQVGNNKARMAELEAQGAKNTDEYKALSKETKKLEGSMDTLAQAADSPIGGFATLFGSVEGLNSMMVLTSETGSKDMQGAMEAMKNSAGATEKAFSKMNDSDMGKINKELNKLKNAGITAGEKLLPLITKGIEAIGGLAEKFNGLSSEQQEGIIKMAGFAAASGPVLKVAGTLTTGLGSLTTGVGKVVEGLGKKGAAGAMETAASSGGLLKNALGLIPGPAKLAVGAVAAVGVGVAVAMKQAHDAALEADLESRFGSIKLSAEEVEDVAARLTTNAWTMKVDAVMEAREKLPAFEQEIQTALEEINKTNWKVSVGLDLTEEEQESYKNTITGYVTSVKEYVEQQHYTTSLALNAVFTPGSIEYTNYESFANEYYNGLNKELTQLGDELSQLVNDAFEDGIMSGEEMRLIDKKKAEIQKKIDELSQARYEVELRNIGADAPKDGKLDADSFKQLQEKISEKLEERKKDVEETTIEMLVPLQAEFNAGKIKAPDFEEQKREIELAARKSLGQIIIESIDLEVDTIKNNFPEITNDSVNEFMDTFNLRMNAALEADSPLEWDIFFEDMAREFNGGLTTLSAESKENLAEIVANMKPEAEQLEAIAQEYKEAGKLPPRSITEGLLDIYELEAMAGSSEHMYELLAAEVANSDEMKNLLAESYENGLEVDQKLADALKDNYGLVYENGAWVVTKVQEGAESAIGNVLKRYSQLGILPSVELITSLNQMAPDVQYEAEALLASLITASDEERPGIIQALKDLGLNGADSLMGSLNSQQDATKKVVKALLSMIPGATAEEREGILADLRSLGIDLSDSQIKAISDKSPELNEEARRSAKNTVDGFRLSIEANKGQATSVIGMWANESMNAFNSALGIHSPSTRFRESGRNSILGYTGGVNENKHLAVTAVSGMGDSVKIGLFNVNFPAYARMIASQGVNALIEGLNSADTYGAGRNKGNQAGGGVQSGMNGTRNAIYNAGYNAAYSGINGVNAVGTGSGYTWGQHLGGGLANGIASMVGSVANAAAGLAGAAARYLHFTKPDEGPLRTYEEWPVHFVTRYADLMRQQRSKVSAAASAIAESARDAMNMEGVGKDIDFGEFAQGDWHGTLEVKKNDNLIDYDRLANVLLSKLHEAPIECNPIIEMKDGDVYFDNEKVGRKQAPVVSRIISKRL